MLHRQVTFLDVRRDGAGDADGRIGQSRETASRGAGQRDHRKSLRTGAFGGADHVPGVAARRDGDQHVALPAERLHLTLEHALGTEVVRDGGEERRVGGERDRRDRWAEVVDRERADELRREVLGVRGAASVAADEELATAPQRGHEERGGRHDVVQALLLDASDGVRGRAEVPARVLGRRLDVHRQLGPSRLVVRRPDLVAAERADTLGAERERGELRPEAFELLRARRAAPRDGSTAGGIRRHPRRRSCPRSPRPPAPSIASPRSGCVRRCGDSSAASRRTRRGAWRRARRRRLPPRRSASRTRSPAAASSPGSCPHVLLDTGRSGCRSIPTFRRTNPV